MTEVEVVQHVDEIFSRQEGEVNEHSGEYAVHVDESHDIAERGIYENGIYENGVHVNGVVENGVHEHHADLNTSGHDDIQQNGTVTEVATELVAPSGESIVSPCKDTSGTEKTASVGVVEKKKKTTAASKSGTKPLKPWSNSNAKTVPPATKTVPKKTVATSKSTISSTTKSTVTKTKTTSPVKPAPARTTTGRPTSARPTTATNGTLPGSKSAAAGKARPATAKPLATSKSTSASKLTATSKPTSASSVTATRPTSTARPATAKSTSSVKPTSTVKPASKKPTSASSTATSAKPTASAKPASAAKLASTAKTTTTKTAAAKPTATTKPTAVAKSTSSTRPTTGAKPLSKVKPTTSKSDTIAKKPAFNAGPSKAATSSLSKTSPKSPASKPEARRPAKAPTTKTSAAAGAPEKKTTATARPTSARPAVKSATNVGKSKPTSADASKTKKKPSPSKPSTAPETKRTCSKDHEAKHDAADRKSTSDNDVKPAPEIEEAQSAVIVNDGALNSSTEVTVNGANIDAFALLDSALHEETSIEKTIEVEITTKTENTSYEIQSTDNFHKDGDDDASVNVDSFRDTLASEHTDDLKTDVDEGVFNLSRDIDENCNTDNGAHVSVTAVSQYADILSDEATVEESPQSPPEKFEVEVSKHEHFVVTREEAHEPVQNSEDYTNQTEISHEAIPTHSDDVHSDDKSQEPETNYEDNKYTDEISQQPMSTQSDYVHADGQSGEPVTNYEDYTNQSEISHDLSDYVLKDEKSEEPVTNYESYANQSEISSEHSDFMHADEKSEEPITNDENYTNQSDISSEHLDDAYTDEKSEETVTNDENYTNQSDISSEHLDDAHTDEKSEEPVTNDENYTNQSDISSEHLDYAHTDEKSEEPVTNDESYTNQSEISHEPLPKHSDDVHADEQSQEEEAYAADETSHPTYEFGEVKAEISEFGVVKAEISQEPVTEYDGEGIPESVAECESETTVETCNEPVSKYEDDLIKNEISAGHDEVTNVDIPAEKMPHHEENFNTNEPSSHESNDATTHELSEEQESDITTDEKPDQLVHTYGDDSTADESTKDTVPEFEEASSYHLTEDAYDVDEMGISYELHHSLHKTEDGLAMDGVTEHSPQELNSDTGDVSAPSVIEGDAHVEVPSCNNESDAIKDFFDGEPVQQEEYGDNSQTTDTVEHTPFEETQRPGKMKSLDLSDDDHPFSSTEKDTPESDVAECGTECETDYQQLSSSDGSPGEFYNRHSLDSDETNIHDNSATLVDKSDEEMRDIVTSGFEGSFNNDQHEIGITQSTQQNDFMDTGSNNSDYVHNEPQQTHQDIIEHSENLVDHVILADEGNFKDDNKDSSYGHEMTKDDENSIPTIELQNHKPTDIDVMLDSYNAEYTTKSETAWEDEAKKDEEAKDGVWVVEASHTDRFVNNDGSESVVTSEEYTKTMHFEVELETTHGKEEEENQSDGIFKMSRLNGSDEESSEESGSSHSSPNHHITMSQSKEFVSTTTTTTTMEYQTDEMVTNGDWHVDQHFMTSHNNEIAKY